MDRTFERIPSGCAISGIMNAKGVRISGEKIIASISLMHDRSNGLGGGFAAYGIYPEFADHYAFHLMYESERGRTLTEEFLNKHFIIERGEPIPTRPIPEISDPPLLWRYFLRVPADRLYYHHELIDERDYVVEKVMYINDNIPDSYVASSGKNMGAFKGVGYPEDIGRFFRLEEYEAYLWTAHGRFPTNTPGWWGGAHPFTLLDWSVVHNGEISSYGINKRYLEMFGYKCTLMTDTEVVAYAVDLLYRRHKLPIEIVAKVLASPFWKDIEKMNDEEKKLYTALRQVYGPSLLNGPFSIIVANSGMMMGLNDRIKLRPMVWGRKGDFYYMASEESAIYEIEPSLDEVHVARGGEPVIVKLKEGEQNG